MLWITYAMECGEIFTCADAKRTFAYFLMSCIQETMPFLLRWKLIHSQHLPCLLQVVLRQGQLLLRVHLSIGISFLKRLMKIFTVNNSHIYYLFTDFLNIWVPDKNSSHKLIDTL